MSANHCVHVHVEVTLNAPISIVAGQAIVWLWCARILCGLYGGSLGSICSPIGVLTVPKHSDIH